MTARVSQRGVEARTDPAFCACHIPPPCPSTIPFGRPVGVASRELVTEDPKPVASGACLRPSASPTAASLGTVLFPTMLRRNSPKLALGMTLAPAPWTNAYMQDSRTAQPFPVTGGITMKGDPKARIPGMYLGGLPGEKGNEKAIVSVNVDTTSVRWGVLRFAMHGNITWDQVQGISFNSETVKLSRHAKAKSVGVFARRKQNVAVMIVVLHDGNAALFQFPKMSSAALRGKVQPVLTATGTPCLDDASPQVSTTTDQTAPVVSVSDELTKLAALQEKGVITQEQFEAQRDKLLESS